MNGIGLYDEHTGLANRTLFQQQLAYAMQLCHRNRQQIALISFAINPHPQSSTSIDTLGLWAQVSERLRSNVRDSDLCGRLYGGQFIVAITQLTHPHQGLQKWQQLCARLSMPYQLVDQTCSISISAGAAFFPEHSQDSDALARMADWSLHQAGRTEDKFWIFDSAVSPFRGLPSAIEMELCDAILNDELHLVYQPQFKANEVIPRRVEALIRWTHPERGQLSPLDFIETAEHHGLMPQLGIWVMRKAITEVQQWRMMGWPIETLAINVSAAQWVPKFTEDVLELLDETEFSPHHLELELTESMVLAGDHVIAQIQCLRDHGIRFSLDDFGTGYSALNKIRTLPIDAIKIDRSFIEKMLDSEDDKAIVQTIVELTHTLKLQCVAEGVELQQQMEQLTEMGCHWLQGFYYGQPLPADQLLLQYLSKLHDQASSPLTNPELPPQSED